MISIYKRICNFCKVKFPQSVVKRDVLNGAENFHFEIQFKVPLTPLFRILPFEFCHLNMEHKTSIFTSKVHCMKQPCALYKTSTKLQRFDLSGQASTGSPHLRLEHPPPVFARPNLKNTPPEAQASLQDASLGQTLSALLRI